MKKKHPAVKSVLHPRNKHRARYDFKELIGSSPALEGFVKVNTYGDESIDFFDPKAVKALNKALLIHYYDIEYWDIPDGYLCPPIPGRADYIHHIADLMAESHNDRVPQGPHIKCLDIGVGASCVYPIIGNKEYRWSFIGTDIDPVALDSAQAIIDKNPALTGKVTLRLQENPNGIFNGILKKRERIDLTICNPPFHASLEEAQAGSLRKTKNLTRNKSDKPILNFGGQHQELWCEGGEAQFVKYMIHQSQHFAKKCRWFSTLISKESNLKAVYKALQKTAATDVRILPMGQGNKKSRIVAWTFGETVRR